MCVFVCVCERANSNHFDSQIVVKVEYSFAFININKDNSIFIFRESQSCRVRSRRDLTKCWCWFFFTSRACLACLHPSPLSLRALFLFLSLLLFHPEALFISVPSANHTSKPRFFTDSSPPIIILKKGWWLDGREEEGGKERGWGGPRGVEPAKTNYRRMTRTLIYSRSPHQPSLFFFFQTPCSNASAIRRFANKYINPSTCSLSCRLVRSKREKLKIRSRVILSPQL